MVSISPRLRDSLDYEEPDATDPRLSYGFRSLTIDSAEYEEHEPPYDYRSITSSPDPSASRRKKRQRQSDALINNAEPHHYRTVADGDLFRLCVLQPGTGTQPIECDLIWASSKNPRKDYKCLSYCWQTTVQDAFILVDGFRFEVTKNLHSALHDLRKRRERVLIWVDQICINQKDDVERAYQVSTMKYIYSRARQVIVWLGDFDRSDKLCEYTKKMKRGGNDGTRSVLNRILPPRQLHDTIRQMLDRPWFSRVWVISEACLASLVKVHCGESTMSWENLVSLVRDVVLPENPNFSKQTDLLGNPRQRIAIITQMISQQRENIAHADISQLLILAKGSNATDHRDKVYAFYGLTLMTTIPNYTRSVESLYIETARDYINHIEACYASWAALEDSARTFQLMSILYSAGALHQHYNLPSWVPDWTFNWHLAPLWAKTSADMASSTPSKPLPLSTTPLRCDFRAGGTQRDSVEITNGCERALLLRLRVLLVDTVVVTSETAPASALDLVAAPLHAQKQADTDFPTPTSTMRYGRAHFRTEKGYVGLATPATPDTLGVQSGDMLAIPLGGDVPVVLRPEPSQEPRRKAFKLLCECFVQSKEIMYGGLVRAKRDEAEYIVLV